MTQWDFFVIISILLPVAVALLNFAIPKLRVHKISIMATALLLIASAVWLHNRVGIDPVALNYHWADRIILVLDLAVLGYITFVAFERRHIYLIGLAILQLVGLVYLEFIQRPDTTAVYTFGIDRLSVVMYLVVSVVGSIICIYALRYMEEHEEHHHSGKNGRFFLWFIMFLGIMNGLIFANNLLWFYFFWEVTTLCSFQLIGHTDTEEARKNALHALFLNSLGGLGLIAAMLLLSGTYGGSALALLAVANSGLAITSTVFVGALFLMVFAGFTKSAQFPFQGWLLGAMVAPTPVSALLHSSTMVKAGVYLILRLAPAYSGVLLSSAIAYFGGFTFFAAALMAVADNNAKRVLAYSTISNLGLIIACCGINTPLAMDAAVLLILFHAISKAFFFMAVGVVEHQLGTRDIETMEGLWVKMPGMTAMMVIGAFSMFLPPFGVLFAKWAALQASIREPFLLILFVAASTLTALFWTKWLGRMLATMPGEEKIVETKPMSPYYQFSLGILAVGAIILTFGLGVIIQKLVVPAVVTWYPPAIQSMNGLNLATFSWANYFNPSILLGQTVFPEGLFPLGLLMVGLLLTLMVPLLAFRSDDKKVSTIYLSGENVEEATSGKFLSAMEGQSLMSLGGYYFKNLLNEKTSMQLNYIALALLAVSIGVVLI